MAAKGWRIAGTGSDGADKDVAVDANGNLQTSAVSSTGVAQGFVGDAALVVSGAGVNTDVFTTQTGDATPPSVAFGKNSAAFEAKLVATTAASCVVTLYGTNEADDITYGVLLGTFTLSLTASGTVKDFGAVTVPYGYVYGVITDSTGTITSIDFNYTV